MKLKIILLAGALACAASGETNKTFQMSFPRWGPQVRAGSVYNFETDLEEGGAFSVNRYYMDLGIARMWDFDRMVSVSAGYGQDDYRFSGNSQPWNNIDNYRLGLFARWGLDGTQWVLFAGPSVRSYGETGSDLGDTLTASFFGGGSYRFSDRLTLGPGLGVVGQLEDNPRYFPVLIVNWGITERLSLETGGGFAATGGPGLSVVYKVSKHWKTALSARYEKKRFRLNGDGIVPNGVGEDRNVPLVANISYFPYPSGYVSAICTLNMAGKLTADDEFGDLVVDREYDSSFGLGFVVGFRF